MARQAVLHLLPLLATVAFSASANPAELFQVEPKLCVLADAEQQCHTTLRVRWQMSHERAALCVMASHQAQPLYCSTDTEVSENFAVSLTTDTRFELRRQLDNALLASVTVTVAKPLTDLRPRRRHGWGIF